MSKPQLYPLKFTPIVKDKIWGGKKLNEVLHKPTSSLSCGESWEISGVPGDVSVVAKGALAGTSLTKLIATYKSDLLGNTPYAKFGTEFPLLIKFIDANQDLSIQVHPNDTLAKKRHNSFGKTEMWYVIQADEGASLISGFSKPTSKEEYLSYFNADNLTQLLNKEMVTADDVFYLPAGRVHTIGKGLLIAEIQQTSDITYRIYDFDRVDDQGNKRALHVEEALDAIDFSYNPPYKTAYNKEASQVQLQKSPYFTTNRLLLSQIEERDYTTLDSFVILMCLKGKGSIKWQGNTLSYAVGETILVPAYLNFVSFHPQENSMFLEVFI